MTWACLRYVQGLANIFGPQNRTQRHCVVYDDPRPAPAHTMPEVSLSGPYTCFSMQRRVSRIGTTAACSRREYPPLAWPVLPQPEVSAV